MTPTEAKLRAEFVANLAMEGDYENAHAAEDHLRRDVLAAIANGSEHAQELARIALATTLVAFPRWYA